MGVAVLDVHVGGGEDGAEAWVGRAGLRVGVVSADGFGLGGVDSLADGPLEERDALGLLRDGGLCDAIEVLGDAGEVAVRPVEAGAVGEDELDVGEELAGRLILVAFDGFLFHRLQVHGRFDDVIVVGHFFNVDRLVEQRGTYKRQTRKNQKTNQKKSKIKNQKSTLEKYADLI